MWEEQIRSLTYFLGDHTACFISVHFHLLACDLLIMQVLYGKNRVKIYIIVISF